MSKDQIWKHIIGKFFREFTEFFLPELHKDIDFNKKPKFLDNQLSKITQKSEGKNRESDKLVEVKLKDGSEKWILVHIEIQDSKKDDFIFRMFQYYYRIFDKFNKKIVALAVYTDSNSKFNPAEYKDSFYGTEIIYKFNTYKVLDQKDKKEFLKNNANPFALVILSSLYYLESKKDDDKRYNFKIELTKLLLEKGYKKKDVWDLFDFIDVLMSFSNDKLEKKYYKEIEDMPKAKEEKIIGGYQRFVIKRKISEVAKNMLKENISVKLIAKVTGLKIREIEELKKEIQTN